MLPGAGAESAQDPHNGSQRAGVPGNDERVIGGAGARILAEKGRRERAATHRGKCPKRRNTSCLFRIKRPEHIYRLRGNS